MKKLLLLLFIICISATAWGMGEKPGITEKGTPIFNTAEEQLSYARNALNKAIKAPLPANTDKVIFACSDLRKLFPAEKDKIIETYFLEGKVNSLKKEYPSAQKLLAKFISLAPTADMNSQKAEAQYLIGKAFYDQGELDKAITAYKKVAVAYPGEPAMISKAREDLAACYEQKGDLSKAIDILDEILNKYTPDLYTQANINLKIALFYQKLGLNKNAALYYKDLIALPDDPKIKGPRTIAKLALEQIEKAEK